MAESSGHVVAVVGEDDGSKGNGDKGKSGGAACCLCKNRGRYRLVFRQGPDGLTGQRVRRRLSPTKGLGLPEASSLRLLNLLELGAARAPDEGAW